jgi:hypothetical protein
MTTQDEAALAPFFAAARAAAPEPSTALLSAILADAAEAGAARRAPPARAPRRSRWRDAVAPALGGWRGAAALAACALFGFWLGLAGGVSLDGTTLQAGSTAAADDGSVEAFFDLAAVE